MPNARPKKRWDDRLYVRAYRHARQGESDASIAKALGVSAATLLQWKKSNKAFRAAIEEGKEEASQRSSISGFYAMVRDRLPDELKEVLDKIEGWEQEPNGIKRIEKLLANQGKYARQQLFLHALLISNFNVTRACRFVRIPRVTFEAWKETDPKFMELLDEVMEARKDLFEDHLFYESQSGEVAATTFALKSIARDRGYSDKVDVNVSGTVQHNHLVIRIDDLNLPLGTRKEILAAIDENRQTIEAS
jgi:hypothetical protein